MVASQYNDTTSYIWQPRITKIQFPCVLKYVLILTRSFCDTRRKQKKDREKHSGTERRKLRDPLFCTAKKANKTQNKTQKTVKDCGKSATQILSSDVSVLVWEGRH